MTKTIGLLIASVAMISAQAPDINGTWIAKVTTPMGEMEIVYRLHVDQAGNISGAQSLPFGDAPITAGKLTGNTFKFTVETESFGQIQPREVEGKVVGEELQLVPAMPGPPPGTGGPRRMRIGIVTCKRGVPTPSYRVSVDYKTLPHLALPALKEIPATGVANTPPMGWNSWNKFHTHIDDKAVRQIADAMVDSGMQQAGYVYVNIDDGWQGTRNADGVLQPNPQFPDMKALAIYVHAKGLKLGIYSSPGPQTCGGFAGSYGHEEIDARTWADWGIDYLKYDWCSAARIWKDADMQAVYQRMGDALHKTGRPIVFALCQYGRANVEQWGPKVGGSLWRTTRDIQDRWESMSAIGFSQIAITSALAHGNWNDPDMLEVGNGGMTTDEYKTHFSMWALLAAPLIAGNDVRALTPEIRDILVNAEVIAIDQNSRQHGAYAVSQSSDGEVWAKDLGDGAYAVALFNRSDNAKTMTVKWTDLHLTGSFSVRDLWKHSDLATENTGFTGAVPPHGTILVRIAKK